MHAVQFSRIASRLRDPTALCHSHENGLPENSWEAAESAGAKCASFYAGGSKKERSKVAYKRRWAMDPLPRARTREYSAPRRGVKVPRGPSRSDVFPL